MNYIIIVVLLVSIVAIIANIVEKHYVKNKLSIMSFKEAVDLTELPIVTFYNNNRKLNFLLDTGSDLSYITKSVLPLLKNKKGDTTTNIISVGGTSQCSGSCYMEIIYKKQIFEDLFFIGDLDEAFGVIKQETGVQIHGILGSKFFVKYKYIFDFDKLIAYSKK